jgi:hypothetical protein
MEKNQEDVKCQMCKNLEYSMSLLRVEYAITNVKVCTYWERVAHLVSRSDKWLKGRLYSKNTNVLIPLSLYLSFFNTKLLVTIRLHTKMKKFAFPS